jgi:hypothetical protein
MYDVFELQSLKSRAIQEQRDVIDSLLMGFMPFADPLRELARKLPLGEFLLFGNVSADQMIRYMLLAIVASDIATVPYPAGRARHLQTLGAVAESYGLDRSRIVDLSEHADVILDELSILAKTARAL